MPASSPCTRTAVGPRSRPSALLIALHSIRSDRLFCEVLGYNILYRWFLDMDLEEAAFDHSSFSKNRARLIEHDIAKSFFAGVIEQARRERLLSDEHFTVDGTLIEAWASFKSFKRKDGTPPHSGEDGTGMVDFRGEKREDNCAWISCARRTRRSRPIHRAMAGVLSKAD